ncbi:rubredoxin domain-containing protein [Mucilaginibacter sp. UR6-11]|uniref:rubredoxin domain-containing protein n=1 Tax=Mucilaginibacter sp. UR6-11 TaxID=1435644 RepID=UPI001E416B64|nr:rubredoxin domain-containing protein [Mucilaginibacter sp. UR6-11]MCC8427095.1 rubredoxin [Mucilaginibacter sp. UR6-11]
MEHLIKINLPGGFISAGDLYEILLIAESAGAVNLRFGNRQQLYFSITGDRLEDLELDMLKSEINYEVDEDQHANIISSYVADTIFNYQEGWVREGVYKDIFDRFDHQPQLKVNLVDSHQTFVPFFSGNINFIASGVSNYWYTYVRFPKTDKLYCFPTLVYSEDIPALAKTAEDIILQKKELFYSRTDIDEELFYKTLAKKLNVAFQPVTEPLKLPDFQLPYYEGFNKYSNKYWLGIYRRHELFPLEFLKAVCLLCLKSRIGQIYTTPWKSIIIKGIEQADRNQWGLILSKYHLNIRHAANELNWQIEDICTEGLELKQQLVRQFEEADLRTYQLCFAVKTQPKTGLQGSIILKKDYAGLYDILHTRDFNPNLRDEVIYKQQIKPRDLSSHLIVLCHAFYDAQSNRLQTAPPPDEAPSQQDHAIIYQCNCCLSRYDQSYGDPENNIEKGIPFETLKDYACPVCEAPMTDFSLVTA